MIVKLLILSFLMAVPTPPGFLALVFLVTFFFTHALLKEIYNAHQ